MSNLLIPEPPLVVLPSLAAKIGLNEAIFLQQLHYWMLRSKHRYDGRTWVHNRISDWEEQFPFWSGPTIRRVVDSLRKSEIVIATDKYNKMPIDKTLWYTIDYGKIPRLDLAPTNDDFVTPNDQLDHSNNQSDRSNDHFDHLERSSCASLNDQLDHSNNHRLPEITTETTTERGISGADAPPPAPSSSADDFAAALCWVCYAHKELETLTDRTASQVRSEAARLLDDGYTHLELRRWFLDHWQKDWRWRKDQERPKPHQVRELIAVIRDGETNKNPYAFEEAAPADLSDPTPPEGEPDEATATLNGFVSFTDDGPESSDSAPAPVAPTQPQPKSPPPDGADPWARIVRNYALGDASGRGNGLSRHLEGSRLEHAGEVDGVPHYVIHAPTPIAAHWIGRSIRNLRMDLSIELGLRSRPLLTVEKPPEAATEPTTEPTMEMAHG